MMEQIVRSVELLMNNCICKTIRIMMEQIVRSVTNCKICKTIRIMMEQIVRSVKLLE